jgi:hypothetical protein
MGLKPSSTAWLSAKLTGPSAAAPQRQNLSPFSEKTSKRGTWVIV